MRIRHLSWINTVNLWNRVIIDINGLGMHTESTYYAGEAAVPFVSTLILVPLNTVIASYEPSTLGYWEVVLDQPMSYRALNISVLLQKTPNAPISHSDVNVTNPVNLRLEFE